MSLEFLHADRDIEEFVNYLYQNGFFISHRCGHMCDIELDRIAAIHELQHDLCTSWAGYFLGNSENKRLLMMDSCGPQSHPSKLGRQGRKAGLIGHTDKDNTSEKELMRLLRNYFRRNYTFRRYNGTTRMSCHFGPHYMQMEADFFADTRVSDLCCGYLCLVCRADQAEFEQERVSAALSRLDIQNIQLSVRPYGKGPGLVYFHIPFLYYAPSFSVEVYSSVLSVLSFNGQIRYGSSNHSYFFHNNRSPDTLTEHSEENSIKVLLQRQW